MDDATCNFIPFGGVPAVYSFDAHVFTIGVNHRF
jgi:hypothetical protein